MRYITRTFGIIGMGLKFIESNNHYRRKLAFSILSGNKTSEPKVKFMFPCFIYCKGIVHRVWLLSGNTINQHYYIDILDKLRMIAFSEESHLIFAATSLLIRYSRLFSFPKAKWTVKGHNFAMPQRTSPKQSSLNAMEIPLKELYYFILRPRIRRY